MTFRRTITSSILDDNNNDDDDDDDDTFIPSIGLSSIMIPSALALAPALAPALAVAIVIPLCKICKSPTLLAGTSSTNATALTRLSCSTLELDSVAAGSPDNVMVTKDVK